jgi:hypothetical protein
MRVVIVLAAAFHAPRVALIATAVDDTATRSMNLLLALRSTCQRLGPIGGGMGPNWAEITGYIRRYERTTD